LPLDAFVAIGPAALGTVPRDEIRRAGEAIEKMPADEAGGAGDESGMRVRHALGMRAAVAVLGGVVSAERGGLFFDRPPPPRVVRVPPHRRRQAVVELRPGRPAEPA